MLARATRPKLSLTVPSTPALTLSVPKAAASTGVPCSPLTFLAPTTFSTSSSPSVAPAASPLSSAILTPTTTRNTLFNARGLAALQVPSQQARAFVAANTARGRKRVQFSEVQSVRCVSPMPAEYYGEYVKMSREERRWGRK